MKKLPVLENVVRPWKIDFLAGFLKPAGLFQKKSSTTKKQFEINCTNKGRDKLTSKFVSLLWGKTAQICPLNDTLFPGELE